MRVIYITLGFGPHDRRFLEALGRTSHQVHVLSLGRPTVGPDAPRIPGRIRSTQWAGLRGPVRLWDVPRLVLTLRRRIRELGPDLIHAGPIQTCTFLAVLTGFRPVLAMSWGFDLMHDAERNAVSRWMTRYALGGSAFFVSDAEVTRRRAITYGMAPARTAVFPWGVDLERYQPSRNAGAGRGGGAGKAGAGASAGNPKRGLTILCNRAWEERYGVDVLAHAFVIAAQRLRRARLILLGSGAQERMIREILAAGGVLDKVRFGGRIRPENMYRWYHKADLFVTPSHVDGSSVSLMEALASGLPVLVSDIPANLEWVRDGQNGWVFRDGDAEHLAARMVWIAAHQRSMRRVARAARKTAERRANWESNFKVLLAAYDRAVTRAA